MDFAIIAIIVLGLFFDYTNGFHDAANVVSTVIATRVLAPFSAIVMAGVLNFIGATQISKVAHTISTGLIDAAHATQFVILSAVAAAILWNLLIWYYAIPSSSSYALIGGLVGSAWADLGTDAILWTGLAHKVIIPMVISPIAGFFVALSTMKILFHFLSKKQTVSRQHLFKHLQIGSACFVALSHGLNDAQKSMGLITLGLFAGGYISTSHIPLWVIIACAIVMGLGTASGGIRIIKTMGFSITKIAPIQGFAAEASASAIILIASFFGMPVSSTHVIAGSITGIGAAKSWRSVNWTVPQKLVLAWLFTLPGAALAGALIHFGAKTLGFLQIDITLWP